MRLKSNRNAMGRRGIVAMLDGLLAYSIAFVAIGIIAVIISNPPQARMKSSYALNTWAEDLADAIGMSLVDNVTNPAGPSKYWLANRYDEAAITAINQSLSGIADEKGLFIHVDIDEEDLFADIGGDFGQASQIATAKRFLIEVNSTLGPTGGVSVLTVKIGRK